MAALAGNGKWKAVKGAISDAYPWIDQTRMRIEPARLLVEHRVAPLKH
jgi:hypothetical protein